MKKPLGERAFRRWCASHNARRHLALYYKTGDGLLIWRAYQEYRHVGLSVPEAILRKFDEYASRLAHAGAAKEVAQAIEMAAAKGGPAGATRAKMRERQRDIVEYVRARAEATPTRLLDDIYEEAARQFGSTRGSVNTLCIEWGLPRLIR